MNRPSGWTAEIQERIGDAVEIEIGTVRGDGSERPWVPIWVVRVGEDVFVRSWTAERGGWYRAAREQGRARIRVGRQEWPVLVSSAPTSARDAVDQAYRSKYGHPGSGSVAGMVTDQAAASTLQLSPGPHPE